MTRPLFAPLAIVAAAAVLTLVACAGTEPIPDSQTPPLDEAASVQGADPDEASAAEPKKEEPKADPADPFAEDTNEYSTGASNFKAPEKAAPTDAPPAPPEVLVGPPMVVGPMTLEAVSLAIRKREGNIKSCFAKRIKASGPTGSMFVSFNIAATGGTTDAKVAKSEMNDAGIDACVLEVFAGARFPARASKDGVTVKYPILLTAP
jgi:TonB family protein